MSVRPDKPSLLPPPGRLNLLEAVTASHPDCLFVRDAAGIYLYCNPAGAELIGRDVHEIIGHNDAELLNSEDAEQIRAQDLHVMSTAETRSDLYTIRHGDGWLFLEMTTSPYRDQRGNLIGVISTAKDVTARQMADQRIHLSEQRYRSLVTAMAEGIVFHTATGEISTCNRQAEKILGLTADQICGRSSLDPRWRAMREDGSPFPGEQHPAMVTLRTGQSAKDVIMGVHKPDGTLSWITINAEPLHREDEAAPYAVACSFSDITDRKNAEDALRESQRRLSEAQQIARIGSWVWTPATNTVWWSDMNYSLYGLAPCSAQPGFETFVSLLHPEDRPAAFARVEAMLAGADEFADDMRIIRPDGTLVWLHSRARATRNAEGNIIRVEGTDQDITARKLVEQALEDREKTFRELADAIPQIVWIAGPDGGLTNLNAKAAEYTGVNVTQLTGWHWDQVIHPDDLPRTLEIWTTVLQDGVSRDIEFRIRHVNGNYRWHITRQVPSRDSSGNIVRWYGTCTDVEDLKHAEATLRNERTLLRTLIDSIPDLVYTKDTLGRFQLCNRALLNFVDRMTEDQLTGRTAFDLFPREYAVASELDDQRVIKQGETVLHQAELVRDASGSENWREVIKAPLKDQEGQIVGLVGISQNIQKRKEREQALAASQERLQLALSAAKMGTWDWNIRENRVFRSAECVAITGIEDPEGKPSAYLNLVHPDDIGHVMSTIDRAMCERTRMEMEFRILRPDGTIRWVSEIGSTFYDSQLNPIRMIGIIQDITERKASEKALRLTQFSIDRVVDSVFWINESAEILDVNNAACEALGYTREELIGARIPDIDPNFPEEQWHPHWEELKRCGSMTFETIHHTKYGHDICTEVTANYLQYEGKEYNCAIVRDITLRKRTEEERDRLWNQAVDPLAIAGFDGVFKQVNPAWTRTLGWSEEELRSRPWMEFVHIDDHDITLAAGRRLIAGEAVTGFQNRYRCRNGQYRWFSWNSIPLLETQTIFGFIRDVTEEKLLEEQLRQSQKMEAIGRLAGGVAHDFNNLLTVINGYSELILRGLALNDPLRLSVSSIRNAGERAAELTSQLLAFSRKAIIEPRILDLNYVIESTSQMLRRLIGEDIALVVNLGADSSHIKADPGQLEQVIMNLTVNARDAMPSGGRLTIQTSNSIVKQDGLELQRERMPGAYVQLLVSDTGQGMPEYVQSKIFEPFFTTKGPGKGTGLGLAVVHGVMKQCGGHIAVSSVPDRGTTFELLFPVALETPLHSVPKPEATQNRATETVLLVEDNDSVRNIIKIALESQGFKVLQASSAAMALEIFEQTQQPVHLLISDVVMPLMGGQQLAELIRTRCPELPVLFISGYSDSALLQNDPGGKRDAFLQKPFTPLGLARKVRSMLSQPTETEKR